MKQSLLIILTVLCLTTLGFQAKGQRCGGDLFFRIYDKEKKAIYPSANDSILINSSNGRPLYSNLKILDSISYGFSIVEFEQAERGRNGNSYNFFRKRTGCGLAFWHITIKKGNKTMDIDFENMLPEVDYLVDKIPFLQGKYYIDFSNPKGAKNRKFRQIEWDPYTVPATLNLKKK